MTDDLYTLTQRMTAEARHAKTAHMVARLRVLAAATAVAWEAPTGCVWVEQRYLPPPDQRSLEEQAEG